MGLTDHINYWLARLNGWKPFRDISSLPEPNKDTKGLIRCSAWLSDRPFITVETVGVQEAYLDGVPNSKFVVEVTKYKYVDFKSGLAFQEASQDPYALYKTIG